GWRGTRIVELAEQVFDVERAGRQAPSDLSFPYLSGTVPVDLDPMSVRVAQVERLADEVIGQADQRHPVARGVREPAGEVGALGHGQGDVVAGGGSDGPPSARL